MPKFMFLQYVDESKSPRPGSPELHAQIDAFAKYLDEVKAAGAFKDGDLARKLGAHIYIDSKNSDAAAELQKLGGAKVILATAPNSKSMSDLFPGLGRNGSMVVVGAGTGNIEVSPFVLLLGKRRLQGWASGTAADSEDTMRFATLTGVRPMIEKFPLEKAAEAYERMNSGHAQFRVVLTM